eukprot:7724005-Lingulodinium_polyedra.AAC.1
MSKLRKSGPFWPPACNHCAYWPVLAPGAQQLRRLGSKNRADTPLPASYLVADWLIGLIG